MNVLDIQPLRALARSAGDLIGDEKIATRFRKLAFAKLLADGRNFRPATEEEMKTAPDWARAARARGQEICVFQRRRTIVGRLNGVARRLAATCDLASADEAARPRDAALITKARTFLDKIERASFDVVARKALYFADAFEAFSNDRDLQSVCEPQLVRATKQRLWSRITSIAELRAVGREFRNCLARTTRSGSYGGLMQMGAAQFWVLREASGEGLMVVMAPSPNATHFTEVRGPGNAGIDPVNVDLVRLGVAIGVYPSQPPPGVASILDLMRLRRRSVTACG